MYFPTADITVNPLLPPLAALLVSFFTSMGGVSGAFLLLPFQMSVLGYVNPSVSATNQLYNVFANPAAIFRYHNEGRLIWPLAWTLVAGTLPGVWAGALIRVTLLPDPRLFKLFVAVVLFGIAAQMLLRRKPQGQQMKDGGEDSPGPRRVNVLERNRARIRYSYAGMINTVSVPAAFVLSVVVGLIGGVYGIGGGAILSPFLVSMMGLPVHTVAGATLFATCITSVAGVAFYMAIAPFFPHMAVAPDWRMALLLSAGGFVGMYLGARCQKHMPAAFIRGVLLSVLTGTGIWYVIEYLR